MTPSNRVRRRPRVLIARLVGTFCLILPACSEELAGPPPKTVKVSGRVLEGNRPVGGGWIEFVPIDGTLGNLRSSPIAADGTFTVDGVGVGTNSIGLIDITTTLPTGGRMFDTLGTTIRREIGPNGDSHLRIELYEEAARFFALKQ